MIGHAHVHASELGTGRRLRMIRECSEVLTQPVRCRAVPPTPAWRMICRDYRSRVSGTITALNQHARRPETSLESKPPLAPDASLLSKLHARGFAHGRSSSA